MAAKQGPLQTKLEPRLLPLLADDAKQLEVIGQWQDEEHAKLLLLCDDMGIEDAPDRFYRLALELARKHYVGFQVRRPTSKWTQLTGGYLVVEVKRLTADRRRLPGHTASWAADQIARRDEWAAFLGGGRDGRGEALRVQYQKFKEKPWSRLMWRLFQMEAKLAELEGEQVDAGIWQAELLDALKNPHPKSNL